jgi:solute carrier family 25 carnitine/acylcarnitine transporter 20/29
VRTIVRDHGFRKLFQGWWATIWREVPAFGMYFASYDHIKDLMLGYFESSDKSTGPFEPSHAQAMTSAAVAGGMAGCLTWGVIYPTDLIKTRIQTMPLDATPRELGMWRVCSEVVSKYGWRSLFRGLSVTLIRAFPVNGTIFPVYEATLLQVVKWENGD